jgi:hypothetical protein
VAGLGRLKIKLTVSVAPCPSPTVSVTISVGRIAALLMVTPVVSVALMSARTSSEFQIHAVPNRHRLSTASVARWRLHRHP